MNLEYWIAIESKWRKWKEVGVYSRAVYRIYRNTTGYFWLLRATHRAQLHAVCMMTDDLPLLPWKVGNYISYRKIFLRPVHLSYICRSVLLADSILKCRRKMSISSFCLRIWDFVTSAKCSCNPICLQRTRFSSFQYLLGFCSLTQLSYRSWCLTLVYWCLILWNTITTSAIFSLSCYSRPTSSYT